MEEFLMWAGIISPIICGVIGYFVNDMRADIKETDDNIKSIDIKVGKVWKKIDTLEKDFENKIDLTEKDLLNKIDIEKKELNDHKLFVARNFTTKAEIKDQLDKMDQKLDNIFSKLDRKADKNN